MGKIIGIDLGTGNSAVAVMEGNKPTIIVNSEGNRTTPSVVCYDGDEVKVGSSAKRQSVVKPKDCVHSIKRFMGCSYDEALPYKDKVAYDVVKGNANMASVSVAGKMLTPQEISAAILGKMKKTAEDYLGESVTEAVITVPAYFNDAQRTATKEAGEIAGLTVRRIINEPTAAALAFGLDKQEKSGKILVFDCGCGTTDLSVLEIGDGLFEVKATNGDAFLGGNDIDNIIIDWISEEGQKLFGQDLRKDPIALQRLKEAAEEAKIGLSNQELVDINLPYITVGVDDHAPKHLTLQLSRAKFEAMIEPFIKKCENLCKGIIKDGNFKVTDFEDILLVGGSTRVPAVQKMLKNFFGKEPSKSVNPDEAVALGAAIQGAVLNGEKRDVVLVDVTPLNLNITVNGTLAHPMIEANTAIPTSASNVFTTAVDNQPAVDIEITQGNRPIAKDNKVLGKFILEGIAPAMRGVPQIEVSFNIDSNGILDVKAVDKATGKEQSITIKGSSKLSKDDISRMKADAEAHAEEDKKRADMIVAINNADSLSSSIKKVLKESADKFNDEQTAKVNESLDNLNSVIGVEEKDRDLDAINGAIDALSKVWAEVYGEVLKSSENAQNGAEQAAPADSSVN